MNSITLSLIIATVLVGGALFFAVGSSSSSEVPANNVTTIDGTQIIAIRAKGGYSPRLTAAKADLPTVIRVTTSGTFDCSSALSIPSLGYSKNLPASGVVDIEVPAQKAGTTLKGLCVMGMYTFAVNFN